MHCNKIGSKLLKNKNYRLVHVCFSFSVIKKILIKKHANVYNQFFSSLLLFKNPLKL